jgi:hypothetical protein
MGYEDNVTPGQEATPAELERLRKEQERQAEERRKAAEQRKTK